MAPDANAADGGATADDETQPEPEPTVEVEMAYGVPVTHPRGEVVLHPSREQLVEVVRALRADGFLMCIDLCGVDYLTHPGRELPAGIAAERFEVVSSYLDHAARRRVRVRVQVPEAEASCPSLFSIHPGVEAMEREVFDMFGIAFDGHPDLTRILMPEEWIGHPLRKDYGVGRIPVQFKAAGRQEASR